MLMGILLVISPIYVRRSIFDYTSVCLSKSLLFKGFIMLFWVVWVLGREGKDYRLIIVDGFVDDCIIFYRRI